VILPQEAVFPFTVPVLVLMMLVPPEAAFAQTTVTPTPEEDIPNSGSSMQLP
jgi:hypothetical protein